MTQDRNDERKRSETEKTQAAPTNDVKRHLDRRLDEALEETFPASDPIAVTPPRRRPSVRRAKAR
ncbi:MAG: hypothetical protein LOD94_09920 [Gammaproteobacteria bacterium]|nr:hypothetical protein [Gammaproteobacteria bacterium]